MRQLSLLLATPWNLADKVVKLIKRCHFMESKLILVKLGCRKCHWNRNKLMWVFPVESKHRACVWAINIKLKQLGLPCNPFISWQGSHNVKIDFYRLPAHLFFRIHYIRSKIQFSVDYKAIRIEFKLKLWLKKAVSLAKFQIKKDLIHVVVMRRRHKILLVKTW